MVEGHSWFYFWSCNGGNQIHPCFLEIDCIWNAERFMGKNPSSQALARWVHRYLSVFLVQPPLPYNSVFCWLTKQWHHSEAVVHKWIIWMFGNIFHGLINRVISPSPQCTAQCYSSYWSTQSGTWVSSQTTLRVFKAVAHLFESN